MKIVYEDPETGFAIRKMNLDDKHDIGLFIQANKNIISEFWRCCPAARTDPFYKLKILDYLHIGLGMRVEHLYEKEKGYVIIENGQEVGTGWVSETTFPHYYYPVVDGVELTTPWTKKSARMYLAMARMMKAQGYTQIFVQVLKGQVFNQYIPCKRFVGEFPFGVPSRKPVLEFWELDIK